MKTKLTHFAVRLLPAFLILIAVTSYGQLVTNTTTLETFSTIQAAIDDDDTQDGDELLVSAGEYFENIIINKSLTLTGPKAGINGNDPSRGTGEAILYPAVDFYTDEQIIEVYEAPGVTINGFTINGNSPKINSWVSANGDSTDTFYGIISSGGDCGDCPDHSADNITIINNIIKNLLHYGIYFWNGYFNPVAKSGVIKYNKVQNVMYNFGIFIRQNYYAEIEYNTITDCRIGILAGFFYCPPEVGFNATISNNFVTSHIQIIEGLGVTISDIRGIDVNFIYNNNPNDFIVENNTITHTDLRSPDSRGLNFDINWTPAAITINNNTINGYESGYSIRNCGNMGSNLTPPTQTLTITGGVVSNCTYGILATNQSGYYGTAQSGIYNIYQASIINNTTAGIFIEDVGMFDENGNPVNINESSVTINAYNCFINGNPEGILVNGTYANAQQVHNNDLSGNSEFAINNLSPNEVNATCNWFGHWSGPSCSANPDGSGSAISDGVIFDPWIEYGTDFTDEPGFQPAPGSCGDIICGLNNNKYLICHKNHKTLCVGLDEIEEHLEHGDSFGECTLKSGEISAELVVGLFPNPSNSYFGLSVESPFEETIEAVIYDLNGKAVKKLNLESGHSYIIGEELKPGIYCLRVVQGQEVQVVKIIKQ